MPNYKIKFEQIGAYKEGDVVPGHVLGDVNYLTRVGAVEETDEPEKVRTGSVEVTTQIEEAVAKATEDLKAEVSALNDTVTKLTKENKKLKSDLKKAKGGSSDPEPEEEVEVEEETAN